MAAKQNMDVSPSNQRQVLWFWPTFYCFSLCVLFGLMQWKGSIYLCVIIVGMFSHYNDGLSPCAVVCSVSSRRQILNIRDWIAAHQPVQLKKTNHPMYIGLYFLICQTRVLEVLLLRSFSGLEYWQKIYTLFCLWWWSPAWYKWPYSKHARHWCFLIEWPVPLEWIFSCCHLLSICYSHLVF